MGRCERRQPPLRLVELPLEPHPVAAPGLVPGDHDVDEPLEEVLLVRLGRAPGVLERLVGGEVLAAPRKIEAEVQISRDRL